MINGQHATQCNAIWAISENFQETPQPALSTPSLLLSPPVVLTSQFVLLPFSSVLLFSSVSAPEEVPLDFCTHRNVRVDVRNEAASSEQGTRADKPTADLARLQSHGHLVFVVTTLIVPTTCLCSVRPDLHLRGQRLYSEFMVVIHRQDGSSIPSENVDGANCFVRQDKGNGWMVDRVRGSHHLRQVSSAPQDGSSVRRLVSSATEL